MSSIQVAARPSNAPERERERAPGAPASTAARMAGVLSIVAGGMHAKALVDHVEHWWFFGLFFGLLACGQVAWGIRVYRGGAGERVLLAGAAASLGVAAIWLMSRTVGIPAGPWAWDAEPAGAIDVVATLDELVIVAFVAVLVHPRRRRLAWLQSAYAHRLGIALATLSLFAALIGGHTH